MTYLEVAVVLFQSLNQLLKQLILGHSLTQNLRKLNILIILNFLPNLFPELNILHLNLSNKE